MKLQPARIAICILCLMPATGATAPREEQQLREQLSKDLVGEKLTFRKSPNVGLNYYIRVEDTEYVLRHKPSGLFPASEAIEGVEITKVSLDRDSELLSWKSTTEKGRMIRSDERYEVQNYFVFALKHPHLGRGELRLTAISGELPASREAIDKALGFALRGSRFSEPALYRANKTSRLMHFAGSGHGSPDDLEISSVDSAAFQDFKPCGLCFNRRLNLSHLAEESELGRETEATLRHYHRLITNPDQQQRVEALGKKVLDGWPARLKGYDYRFDVIDDGGFNAIACAGGYIFVARGLLAGVESDDELEAVLAHEIAHVEQRHALKEYQRRVRDANAAAIAAAIIGGVGATAAAASNNRNVAVASEGVAALVLVLAHVGSTIALKGYSKEHEKEADLYAAMYLQDRGKGVKPLISVLKKIRTAEGTFYGRSGDMLGSDSHPTSKDRLFIIESASYRKTPSLVYDAVNKAGELVYTLTFDGVCTYTQRDGTKLCRVFTQINTSSTIGKPVEVSGLNLRNKNEFLHFNIDGKVEISPLDRTGLAFFARSDAREMFTEELVPIIEGISADKMTRRLVR
jgi:Zn-dependent protease with chaperone function